MPRRHGTILLLPLLALIVFLCSVGSAGAVAPAPGWAVSGRIMPTDPAPGSEASLQLTVFDVGAGQASAGATVTDTLPEDLTATGANQTYIYGGSAHIAECLVATGHEVKCELSSPGLLPGDGSIFEINVAVKVGADAEGTGIDRASVSGGGAAEVARTSFPITVQSSALVAGFAGLNAWIVNADGSTDTQAGSHPYELATEFNLNDEA